MRKMGKLPPRNDKRTLWLHDFAAPTLPPPPLLTRWRLALPQGFSMGVKLNNLIGDCAVAAPAYGIQSFTANTPPLMDPADGLVLGEYMQLSGYQPTKPDGMLDDNASDTGCVELDVLNRWRNVGLFGHQILGYTKVKLEIEMIRQAIAVFVGSMVGVSLPDNFETELDAGLPWRDITMPPNPNNGHAMWAVDYDQNGPIFKTWGTYMHASWAWALKYLDEAYAVIAPEIFNVNGGLFSPQGWRLVDFQKALPLVSK